MERTENEMFLSKKEPGTLLLTTPGASDLNFLIVDDRVFYVKLKDNAIQYDASKYKDVRAATAIKVTDTGETEVIAGIKSRKLQVECTGQTYEVFIGEKSGYDNSVELSPFFKFSDKKETSKLKGFLTKLNVKTPTNIVTLIELQSIEPCNFSLSIDRGQLDKLVRKVLDDPDYDPGVLVTE